VFEIRIEDSFDFLSREYADLFARSAATAFQHPVWLDRLYAKLAPYQGAEPLVITVRSAPDGRLDLVLPLVRLKRGGVRVIEFADLQVSDYASPVCCEATLKRVLHDEKACKAIRRALLPYDVLRIQKVLDRSMPLEALLGAKPRQPMQMNAYAVPLQGSYQEWRSRHVSQSYRKELDKKNRQLLRKGQVRFECTSEAESITTTFDAMRDYRGLRFSDDDLLQKPRYFEFYLEIATEGARLGFARTYRLLMDGRPIAGVLGLAHKGECQVILGGFDHAGYKNYSIGSLVFQEIANDCLARGDTCLDFTIGDEPYKRLFGAQPAPVWAISGSGSSLGRAANLVVKVLPLAKDMAKLLHRRWQQGQVQDQPVQPMKVRSR
jgi:CelD/BcsL family acetyltransferase involved in cellulose biosynthesis